jgi:hypothetical protein
MEHVQNGKAHRHGAHVGHPVVYTAADERRARGEPTAHEEQRFTMAMITGGAGAEAFFGAAAAALAIIGLAGVVPRYMAGTAAIALGTALIAGGGAVAARWKQDVRRFVGKAQELELELGLAGEVLGGIGGIVLGVIGLAGYAPQVMFPCAAIAFGGTLLLGGAAQPAVAILAHDDQPRFERLGRLAMDLTGGVMAFVGLGAVVLGVLGLIGLGSGLVLSIVAMLAMGSALMLAGMAEAARFSHRLAELS